MGKQSVHQIVDECERYWAGVGLDERALREMVAELELHLHHAAERGKPMESVVGTNLHSFAEMWAREHAGERLPSWDEVERAASRGRRTGALAVGGVVALAAMAGAMVLAIQGSEETTMEDSMWIWLWLSAAVVFSFGEVVTAGFFMLPFAVGAAAAFMLAVFGVAVGIQWVVFIAISVAALVFVRNYVVGHEDEHQHSVGANRFVGQLALVTATVDRLGTGGMVRMETEDWRATTTGGPIEAGAEVVVTGITGSRLIVEVKDN